MEIHCICPFLYRSVLCVLRYLQNHALTLTTQKSLLAVSLSLSHIQIGLPQGYNLNFPTSIPGTFIWESPLEKAPGTRLLIHRQHADWSLQVFLTHFVFLIRIKRIRLRWKFFPSEMKREGYISLAGFNTFPYSNKDSSKGGGGGEGCTIKKRCHIERFYSRGQQMCKFITTKESF